MFDVILRHGQIADGSGQPTYPADLGIKGDRIIAIGDLKELDADSEIDLSGQIVAPGFIDIHTHSDAILLADSHADSQILQGVTTEMGGQCGLQLRACTRSRRRWRNGMVGRLPGVNATWQSFGEYLDVAGAEGSGRELPLAHSPRCLQRAAR